jgi:hypothetical protein
MWTEVRANFTLTDLNYSVSNIIEFWGAILRAIATPDTDDQEDLSATIRRSPVASAHEVFWTGSAPVEVPDALDRFLKAPREERLRFVDGRIARIARGPGSTLQRSAFAGYLLSLVADGDFSLWSTAIGYNDLPTMPLWFAFFTGVHERSNVLVFGQSIGRRIIRSLSDSDEVDIDAREFLVGRRARSRGAGPVDFPLRSLSVMSARLGVRVRGWFSIRESLATTADEQRRQGSVSQQTVVRDSIEVDVSRKPVAVPREVVEARALAERIILLLTPLVHGSRFPDRPGQTQTRTTMDARPPAAQLFPDEPIPERSRTSGRKTKRKP